MKLLPIYLTEIESNEATNDEASLQTLLDGKRNVGFASIKKSLFDEIQGLGIKIIPIHMWAPDLYKSVIYREEGKKEAMRLYQIAMSHGGYLNDQSPEEAREIGELLGYSEESIDEYVERIYQGGSHRVKKHSETAPSEDPNDYSDFH